MTVECLMDDGTWQSCDLLRTDGRVALLRHRGITWWAAPDEWRFPPLPESDRWRVQAIEASALDDFERPQEDA